MLRKKTGLNLLNDFFELTESVCNLRNEKCTLYKIRTVNHTSESISYLRSNICSSLFVDYQNANSTVYNY